MKVLDAGQSESTVMSSRLPRPQLALAVLLSAFVIAFRVAAYRSPSRFVEIPDPLALPLGALGLLFLACGIWAWLVRPSGATATLLVYGAGMGVHWGGSVGAASPAVESALLVFYAAATAAGDGAFLDLALRSPRAGRRPHPAATLLYLFALALLVAVPVVPFLPPGPLASALGLLFPIFFLASVVGTIVFVGKWVRATRRERRELGLTPVAGALLVAAAANIFGDAGALPGPPQAWGLPFALVPLALARALTRHSNDPATRG